MSSNWTDADSDLRLFGGTANYLGESFPRVPAPEPFRSSLRDWLERGPSRRWWDRLLGPVRRRLAPPLPRPSYGFAIGAGAAAAIVVGVVVLRHRRTITGPAPG